MNNNVMIGGIRSAKGVVTWVYGVTEIIGTSEEDGLPLFGKTKDVKVKRSSQRSADNFVKSKYSYKNTGKHYYVELDKMIP